MSIINISFQFIKDVRQRTYDITRPHIANSAVGLDLQSTHIDLIAKALADGKTFFSFIDEDREITIEYNVETAILLIDLDDDEDLAIVLKFDEDVRQMLQYAFNVKQNALNLIMSKNEDGNHLNCDDYYLNTNNVIPFPGNK